jgi:hypothetical protein
MSLRKNYQRLSHWQRLSPKVQKSGRGIGNIKQRSTEPN